MNDDGSRSRYVNCLTGTQLHRLAYREWGDPANPRVVVCVHGLTRNSRDFGPLGRALSDRWRVIAADMPGRGESERLADPMLYQVPTYVANAVTLLARLDVETVDWVGISLGGLMGMALGAFALAVRRLVSDAGPILARAAIERIASYVGVSPAFPTRAAAYAAIRDLRAFGPHTDAQWDFVDNVLVRRDDGTYALHYDPALGVPFRRRSPCPATSTCGVVGRVAPTMVIAASAGPRHRRDGRRHVPPRTARRSRHAARRRPRADALARRADRARADVPRATVGRSIR
jgi:pimeloyl-ACP methyl ester carboxylesterase